MAIQQFQEQLVKLSVAERLQIAPWLIGTALSSAEQVAPTNGQGLSDDQEQQILEEEIAAFRTMHAQLVARIPGQYAAIHQGQLIEG